MKGLTMVMVILFLIAGIIGFVKYQESQNSIVNLPTDLEVPIQETISTPTLDQTLSVDSDGDGFSDWFEENVAKTDSLISNDRYVILFDAHSKSDNMEGLVENERNFWLTKGKVPPENVIMVKIEADPKKKNTGVDLKKAIEQIAKKADQNDIVFLDIQCHGYVISNFVTEEDAGKFGPEGSYIYIKDGQLYHHNGGYILLDEWVDKIDAKVVIVHILACGCEAALSVLKDGPCPRIVLVYSAGEFTGALGKDYRYPTTADTKYGNGDGYVSVGEIGNWIDNDPRWGRDWSEIVTGKIPYEDGRSFVETEGYSKMSDPSNIAEQTYLIDCKIPS